MVRKILIAFIICLASFSFALKEETKTVFICKSKNRKKFHYAKNCRGLSACKHTIDSVSITDAKSIGLTLCGWED